MKILTMHKQMIAGLAILTLSNIAAADVREELQAVADAVASTGNEAAAIKIDAALDRLSDDELERVYGNADLKTLAANFRASGEALKATDRAVGKQISLNRMIAKSTGFPDAEGQPTAPLCPFSPNRSDADSLITATLAIHSARVLLEGAKGLWSGLSRGCDETVVVAGFGGNVALACIPADIVLFAAELAVGIAEEVVEHLDACDAAVDAAEIEGTYERVGHMHDDLNTHDTELKAQVTTHDTDIKFDVVTHDTDIKADIVVHDTDIKADIVVHDTDIKADIATHDADVKALLGTLQTTVDENQRLIKVSMSRQLEIMRLLITQQGRREINADVLSCTGDDCPEAPEVISCKGGDLDWPCL